MANRERGEIEIDIKGKPYTLKLSMNAAAIVQTRHKKTIGQMMTEAASLDFTAIRSIVWLLLQKHHAAEFKTEEAAGDFIDEAGGVMLFFNALEQLAIINAEGANPPTDQQTNGTGESSTLPLAASA